MSNEKQFVLAVDIGYSNLKVAYGSSDEEDYKSLILPATAGPREKLPRMNARSKDEGEIRITLDNVPWVACVDPGVLEGWTRELNHEFTSSDNYRALLYAALQMPGVSVIDKVVTGLPVNHWNEPGYIERLEKLIVGKHQVSKGRAVEVKSVEVLPQPAGAFYKFVIEDASEEQLVKVDRGFVAVCDPGYFSFDYCGFLKGGLRKNSSGTSLEAMSRLIEVTNTLIHEDNCRPSSVEEIETALQKGETQVLAGSNMVELAPYLSEAKVETADKALKDMVQDFRTERHPALIIMAGGGGSFYEEAVSKRYDGVDIVNVSPTGIVEGFWQKGVAGCQ